MTILEKYGVMRDEDLSRDPKLKNTDRDAVRAIAQAAVNVELFTIPLYMVAMYSIQGTHQITGANAFYEGRFWPGRAPLPDAPKDDAKAQVFNLTFKVFIEEMLHLELASNLCKVIGVDPSFTELSPPKDYAWTCYSDATQIPYILDFKDCVPGYADLRVKLDAMNDAQVRLFLAIEETEEDAEKHIRPECRAKYFPDVPFKDYRPGGALPLFGSIGAMYLCLWKYLNLRYSDGTTLWQYVQTTGVPQRDLFNSESSGHPKPEYPGFKATLEPGGAHILAEIMRIINAITDQGEGKGVVRIMQQAMQQVAQKSAQPSLQGAPVIFTAVSKPYQADYPALKADYKGYSDTGKQLPVSGDAFARGSEPNRILDHFEVFANVRELIKRKDFETWDVWHAKGNTWTAQLLQPDPKRNTKYTIPPADKVAHALNALKDDSQGSNYKLLSQAATGAIAGITRVLNDYWKSAGTEFPFPSMSGSGDRVSICWAVFGKPPNLALGIEQRQKDTLYHACQGLDLSKPSATASCAALAVYHTCKGSNQCKAEGGCGFVQSASGGGNCSQTAKVGFSAGCSQCGSGKGGSPYSAPSDNRCGGFGGCAVPISASQLFPAPADGKAVMNVYDFVGADETPKLVTTIDYKEGEPVYDIAWKAYTKVLESRQVTPPEKPPEPSIFRLAFPPST